ncbi:MAG: ABC transporter ATP-binding protein [Gammaproteobacteria bacterium HGW-Gammaproteobacteria-10]|nr:MAG: ABC transporter ATP-binding protein [Gammaproteobacteria bacterium HGW-Gammaproteobacteria-10]
MPLSHNETFIELTGLTKNYRESGRPVTIFDNLQLSVKRGELLVLLGRSGSGKSTLLNLLGGIDRPESGRIVIDGIDLTVLSEHRRTLFRRHHIGFVFQSYQLIPTLTVLENLLLPLELIRRITRKDQDKATDLLNSLELSDRLDTYPDRLSGGEQQRVAIARALIHDPGLVLADEPTGNLDLQTGQQVMSLLDKLVRQSGKTLILATHSREVMGIADRILTIRDHALIETDD